MNRRGFLAAMLAAAAAPAIVKASSIMRVRPLVLPGEPEFDLTYAELASIRARARAELAGWWASRFDELVLRYSVLVDAKGEPIGTVSFEDVAAGESFNIDASGLSILLS